MRQATVVRIPTMPSINPTKRRLWEYIFPEGTEGHWPSLQGAMGQSRIFQDSAGTIPVTTFDHPVGKIVRGAGTVDLVQSVSASRLTMARWPRGGRRNLLSQTNNFLANNWGVNQLITTPAGDDFLFTAPAGVSATFFIEDTQVPVGILPAPNSTLVQSIEVKAVTSGIMTLSCELDSYQLAGATWRRWDIEAGLYLTGWGGIDWGIIPLDDDWYRIWLSYTYTGQGINTRCRFFKRFSELGDDSSILARKPQLAAGGSPSTYQRVTTANDVTEEGVESLWHLYNDGGDSLQTDGPVPAGTYGYAYVDPYGEITFDTRVSDGINPVTVADDPGRYLDLILRKGDFSAGEKAAITDYWERRYK